MYKDHRITVIIPALNEEVSLPKVLGCLPAYIDRMIVVDNGSIDNTTEVALVAGAKVYQEKRQGYGWACLKGMEKSGDEDITLFIDADFSDFAEEATSLLEPIVAGHADFVIGSRVLGNAEPGALNFVQRYGNGLACWMMKLFWGTSYTDLGPFRAISRSCLDELNMQDKTYGWTVEMQVKAAIHRLTVCDVPVSYRQRIGVSKISGTLKGIVMAGTKIITTLIFLRIATFRRYKHNE
jgi:glycosyltransferase involved in cell wall biosynthesis